MSCTHQALNIPSGQEFSILPGKIYLMAANDLNNGNSDLSYKDKISIYYKLFLILFSIISFEINTI